jgi:hypothetical protein
MADSRAEPEGGAGMIASDGTRLAWAESGAERSQDAALALAARYLARSYEAVTIRPDGSGWYWVAAYTRPVQGPREAVQA